MRYCCDVSAIWPPSFWSVSVMVLRVAHSSLADEGMTPRSSILAYLVPAKEEARSKDT
jgi:hypothetical protein